MAKLNKIVSLTTKKKYTLSYDLTKFLTFYTIFGAKNES